MFVHQTKVRMHDTDMAGILYFANIYRFAHDAFEDFMVSEGVTIRDLVENKPYLTVVVHSEADYLEPLKSNDILNVYTSISHIGTSSFSISYQIYKTGTELGTPLESPILCGKCKTIHVVIDKKHRSKIAIPDELLLILDRNLSSE